ncbi:unnamed protein product [Effrenium voratum]|uniref:Uncharacterized protein n=1 Tax=Effrenium voratum TaxID=2562239 RepID=A0AA36N9F8_9DINO|nr:unnamed protein product [Effrenium voratum]
MGQTRKVAACPRSRKVANYQHSTATPVLQDKYWREGLERGQRDHAFSVFNDPFPKASYAYINTTSNDFLGRTWQVLHHTKSTAAGKCSFHHNVAKPLSNTVKANSSTMSFEVRPDMQARCTACRVRVCPTKKAIL